MPIIGLAGQALRRRPRVTSNVRHRWVGRAAVHQSRRLSAELEQPRCGFAAGPCSARKIAAGSTSESKYSLGTESRHPSASARPGCWRSVPEQCTQASVQAHEHQTQGHCLGRSAIGALVDARINTRPPRATPYSAERAAVLACAGFHQGPAAPHISTRRQQGAA